MKNLKWITSCIVPSEILSKNDHASSTGPIYCLFNPRPAKLISYQAAKSHSVNIESRGFEHHDSIHRFHSVIASISPGNPMITLPAIGMVPLYISRSSYHIRITTLESTISPFENSKNQSIPLRRFITTISLSRTRVFFLYFESKMKRNW